MRIIVFFDLPMETVKEKSIYTHFRKFLIKNGFIMMQKSVYCKLALNKTVSESIKSLIRKNKPPNGLLQVLEITEKQYSVIEYLLGESQTKIIESDKRVVEI